MSQSHLWTQYEDLILKTLRKQYKKWNMIAQKMNNEYSLPFRTGQQCQQRYSLIHHQVSQQAQWTYEQQKILYQLHNQLGNKWGIIGQQILGRSDNQVKNHLYSKLRKSLRKINKIIKQNYKKQYKQIRQNIICKIIQGSQDKFKHTPLLQKQTSQYCTQLKNKMIYFSYQDININPLCDYSNNQIEIRKFIEELIEFTKQYKRKPKNVRRASGQEIDTNILTLALINQKNFLNIPIIENKRIKSTGHSEVSSDQDSDQMKQFNMGSIKIPNGFKINPLHSNNNISNNNIQQTKDMKQNIIIKLSQNNKFSSNYHQNQPMQQDEHNSYQNNTQQEININISTINKNYSYLNMHPSYSIPSTLNQNFTSSQTYNTQLQFYESYHKSSGSLWNSLTKQKVSNQMVDENQLQNQFKKMGLLEENIFMPPLKKFSCSKKSSFSSYLEIQQEQENIFNDDSIRLKNQMNGSDERKIWNIQSSVDGSDKLFNSFEKENQYFNLISSVQSKFIARAQSFQNQ